MPDPAPFLASAPAHHPWHRRLFVAPLAERDRDEIFELARVEGRAFLDRYRPSAFAAQRGALDDWYRSAQGQDVLCGATRRLWRHLMALAPHAMPAHDARHAVVLVPAAAVLIAHDERIAGSARLGVLAALLHDQGRWAEARLHGHPTEGLLHARLGFLLAREFLRDSAIPPALQDELLHAVLVHTSGADADSPDITKLAVAADMTQLHGPEFVLRLMHHLSLPPAPTCFVDECTGTSLVDRFDHFLGQRRDLLFASAAEARERGLAHLWAVGEHLTGAPAWEARPLAARRIRSPALDAELARQRSALRAVALDTADPALWVARLLDAPLACDAAAVKDAVMAKARQVPAARRRPLAEALALATRQRDVLAEGWRARLEAAAAGYGGEADRFMAGMAAQLRSALAGPKQAVALAATHAALAEPA
jgi:hypothetical protein